jgi:hypothetical protein
MEDGSLMRKWMPTGIAAVAFLALLLPVRLASAQQDSELKKQLDAMQAQMEQLRQENQGLRSRLDAVERKEPPKRGFTDDDARFRHVRLALGLLGRGPVGLPLPGHGVRRSERLS